MITDMNHEKERRNDVNKILNSPHPRKIVVAGPGTGKSYLFEQAIRKKKAEGKDKFLAITFIGKLGDVLADDLAGLAETKTLHGFARKLVLEEYSKGSKGWIYYPKMTDIIEDDLNIKGITEFKIGDEAYKKRTEYYKAIGERDVVHYAVQICKNYHDKIPEYDLILIDEFQDFNETEAEFVDWLATKNEILIVGDDDQALYTWKGSHPKFIRSKFDESNTNFESHTLKYCSRCTEVVINAFYGLVKHFKNKLNNRIDKDYICYYPEKEDDNKLNPNILILEEVGPRLIPTIIKNELSKILKEQKIKSVLIIGEGKTCRYLLSGIAKKLREFGFANVKEGGRYNKPFSFKPHVIEGYKILLEKENDVLAWRLLIEEFKNTNKKKRIILDNYDNSNGVVESLPSEFKKTQEKNAETLQRILNRSESGRNQIADSSTNKLLRQIVLEEKEKREIFINQLIDENNNLPRPLANLDITVCNILGSKGLGADVVFVVGFDQGKLPSKEDATDSEIWQILVALTRTKKCIYFINTKGKEMSQFINHIDKEFYKII